LKESAKVKKVLSANQQTIARVEALADDIDLYQPISRQEFEETCADLFERVVPPLQRIIEESGVSLVGTCFSLASPWE